MSGWCWARRKKNSEEIKRRKKNPRNGDGDEEERRERERRKEKIFVRSLLNDCKFSKTKLPKLVITVATGGVL